MEVFIHNLPAAVDFTPEGLALQLQPFMRALGINDTHYHCEKPRRKRYGFITFLHKRDAARFLQIHGEHTFMVRTKSKTESRLHLQGAQVMCRPSKKEPDAITLRALAAAKEKPLQDRITAAGASSAASTAPAIKKNTDYGVSFQATSVECGHYKYLDTQEGEPLAFLSEIGLLSAATVRFANKNIVIRATSSKIVVIPLNSVIEVAWSHKGHITLTLSIAPHLFSEQLAITDEPTWTRVRLTDFGNHHSKVTGACLIFHLTVLPENMHVKMAKLSSRGTLTISKYSVTVLARNSIMEHDRVDEMLERFKKQLIDIAARVELPFSILFQLQALVYNGYLHPKTVYEIANDLRNEAKARRVPGGAIVSVEAMKKLMSGVDWPSPHGNPDDFRVRSLLYYLEEAEKAIQNGAVVDQPLDQTFAHIHRVNVTPTRITLHGPEPEAMNRILRKFPKHWDYFIRVQFCDENGQDLRFSPSVSYEQVYGRFKRIMTKGISIAGRTYTFLGWSHSSLRSRSMWFVAPFVDDQQSLHTHFTIIKDLGNFDSIRSPAKCAARIGQAFSETPFVVPLDDAGITVYKVRDVMSPDKTHVFSDGVGSLSQHALAAIWDYIPEAKGSPTCFQVRHGGSKGMLALDTRLSDCQIRLRPSMIKFESDDIANLELCDMASKPIPLHLNRQLIKILEDIGTSEDWFLSLQQLAIADIRGTTVSAKSTARFLEHQSLADSVKLPRLVRLADRQGIDYRREPFLKCVVEALLLRELRLLKHKARIPVQDGITLYGIMDETGLLREGEVYVTYEPRRDSKGHTVSQVPFGRKLIVTRSPALHPGDVQTARNVLPPAGHALRRLRNCIVFSSRGERDLPSQLSGGDLDGDIYNVIWDPEALGGEPPTIQPRTPAEYARPAAVDVGHKIKRDDMADFFINFMKTDQLGVIAMRHMILADRRELGTQDPDCLTMAEMHSTAVDFSKTGLPFDMRRLPRCNAFRPDFMSPGALTRLHSRDKLELEQYEAPSKADADDDEAPTYKYYESPRVLGQLYRAVDEHKIWSCDIQAAVKSAGPSFWEAFRQWADVECRPFGINGKASISTQLWEEAKRIEMAYDDAVLNAMYDFSEHPTQPISELEVFIGAIINKTGVQTRRQRDTSHKLRDEFERIATWSIRQIRRVDAGAAADADAGAGRVEAHSPEHVKAMRLCLACMYVVDMERPVLRWERPARGGIRLQSFRLVAASAFLQELERSKPGGSV